MLDIHLHQRHTSPRIREADGVEGDVDAARLVGHRLQVPVHCLLVESVDPRSPGGSAGGNDILGDTFDGCQVAPGEKQIGPSDAKARATALPIAPPAP